MFVPPEILEVNYETWTVKKGYKSIGKVKIVIVKDEGIPAMSMKVHLPQLLSPELSMVQVKILYSLTSSVFPLRKFLFFLFLK